MVSFNKDKSNGKFWSNQFSGNIEKTHFPFDYYENNYTDNNIASVDFTLSKHISNKIMSICAGSDNNIFAFLVTNVIGLLYRYSGKKESIIGIPINKQLGKERLLNTSLFIRNDITDSMSYKELLVQVRNSIRDVNKNQNYHVRGLLSELGFSTDKQESNLAHVKIMYDNIHFKDYLDNINSSMFFIFKNNDDYIECTVEYDKTLYRSLTIERIISHYIKMIKAAVENILIPLNDISLIEIQEKEQILQVFNDTSVVYDRDKTIQDLFEVQAMKYKDRIAVNYDGMTLTYSELNNKANYIARSLVEKGVTHDDIIAINANKSLEMIIGILAVLKAGAAYLPLDFNYPSQRIQFMLDDCGVKLLLSNFDLDMEYEGIE
ncbi:AMP-binding protein, partial [Vallitalea longa]|uniref:AMP-binding protein n=1 Tax=Vallitalea longa TaxID=2936439 RepID=UPI002491F348